MSTAGILLDVNETLFPITPVADRFAAAGLDAGRVDTWFARVLRDGFALAATGQPGDFPALGRHHLGVLLRAAGRPDHDEVVDGVLAGFEQVVPHDDVPEGLAAAADAGLVVATLTNGTAAITSAFLERAGLARHVRAVLAAADSGTWKPHRDAYRWAAGRLGIDPGDLVLVAVHPWDVHGARRAGLRGAWLDRGGADWPDHFATPDLVASSLPEVVAVVATGGSR